MKVTGLLSRTYTLLKKALHIFLGVCLKVSVVESIFSKTGHIKECHGQLNWIYPRTTAVKQNMYKRKVSEALEKKILKTLRKTDKMFKVLNRNNNDYVTTNSCKSLFRKVVNHCQSLVLTLNFTLIWKQISLS